MKLKKITLPVLALLACLLLGTTALAAGPADENGAPADCTEEEGGRIAVRAAGRALGTPYGLEWDVDYHRYYHYDGVPGYPKTIPGMISWKIAEPRQSHNEVCIYRKTAGGDELIDRVKKWYAGDNNGSVEWNGERYASCFRFLLEPRESGEYYFTVKALGDQVNYEDSGTAVSGILNYVRPAEALTAPVPPAPAEKEGRRGFSWERPGEDVLAYYVKFFYAPDLETEPAECGGIVHEMGSGQAFQAIPDSALEEHGGGYYFARLMAVSKDIKRIDSSPWSELSGSIYIRSDSDTLKEIAAGLGENASDEARQAAIDSVRDIPMESLAQLMAADRDNSGAAGDVARLEELTGNRTEIAVSGTMEGRFPRDQIAVTGAGLNVDAGKSVTLSVGEPDAGAIIPTMCANTVQFSMELKDGAGAALPKLTVPVKITLPVPEGINPNTLVILHHHADGTYEEVFEPYVREEDGRWLATFVVRSFSTFTFGERRLSAERAGGGVEAALSADAAGLCALYGEDGRMLEVRPFGAGDGTLRFTDGGEDAYVKAFFPDDQSRPSGGAWYADVKKGE